VRRCMVGLCRATQISIPVELFTEKQIACDLARFYDRRP
jgi:hypothetical protein